MLEQYNLNGGRKRERSCERQPLDRLGALSHFDKLKAPSLSRGLSNGQAGGVRSLALAATLFLMPH